MGSLLLPDAATPPALQRVVDTLSSVTIEKLQVGHRYCVMVQYTYFQQPVGVPSCARCELIPESGKGASAANANANS